MINAHYTIVPQPNILPNPSDKRVLAFHYDPLSVALTPSMVRPYKDLCSSFSGMSTGWPFCLPSYWDRFGFNLNDQSLLPRTLNLLDFRSGGDWTRVLYSQSKPPQVEFHGREFSSSFGLVFRDEKWSLLGSGAQIFVQPKNREEFIQTYENLKDSGILSSTVVKFRNHRIDRFFDSAGHLVCEFHLIGEPVECVGTPDWSDSEQMKASSLYFVLNDFERQNGSELKQVGRLLVNPITHHSRGSVEVADYLFVAH